MAHEDRRSAGPAPRATEQSARTNRLGNNFKATPGVGWYAGTRANPGPFRMATTGGGRRGRRGRAATASAPAGLLIRVNFAHFEHEQGGWCLCRPSSSSLLELVPYFCQLLSPSFYVASLQRWFVRVRSWRDQKSTRPNPSHW